VPLTFVRGPVWSGARRASSSHARLYRACRTRGKGRTPRRARRSSVRLRRRRFAVRGAGRRGCQITTPNVLSAQAPVIAHGDHRQPHVLSTGILVDVGQMHVEGVLRVILCEVRDPRFVTSRPGGTLTGSDHQLVALWAADYAQHILDHFERARPGDDRPRRAIELGRAWARGEITMTEARAAGGHANGAARELSGEGRHAACAAGRAAASHTLPRTSSVRPHLRSRPHALPRRKDGVRAQDEVSAGGSAPGSPNRLASSYSTTSCRGTTSAARCSTAETQSSTRQRVSS